MTGQIATNVCTKCNGIGWYEYDPRNHHSVVCSQCCKHDKGFWLLRKYYGKDNNKWCCLNGCGFTLTYSQLKQRFSKDIKPLIMTVFKDE